MWDLAPFIRLSRRLVAAFLMCLGAMLAGTGVSHAQSRALFEPVPGNQIAAPSPEQARLLDALRKRPSTASVQLVRLNLEALSLPAMVVTLPDAGPVEVARREMMNRGDRNFAWTGEASGAAGSVTLIVRNANVTGSIRIGGKLYSLQPLGDGVHALVTVDQSKFREHPPSFREIERRGGARAPSLKAATADSRASIDAYVVYTTAAKNAVADIEATVELAVLETNQSYVNSNIYIDLGLSGAKETAYSEDGKTWTQVLADLVNGTEPSTADVHQQRDALAADVVVLLLDPSLMVPEGDDDDPKDTCGLAADIMATAASAYALVAYDCATGNYSFGHEIGHLQGARHDDDKTLTPYPYGHGYKYVSPDTSWRTVMAYNCKDGCPRLQYWSNPNINYPAVGGVPMGTASTNDNARVLNQTAATVGAFRLFKPPATLIDSVLGSGPGLAAFKERLYGAFQDPSSHNLSVMTFDGSFWLLPANANSGIKIGGTPALLTDPSGGTLYATFQSDGGDKLLITASVDAAKWGEPYEVPGASIQDAPAMAVFRNQMFIAFRSKVDSSLSYTILSQAGVSKIATAPGVTIGSAPSMAVFNDKLYVAYKANDTSKKIYITNFDGKTWAAPKVVSDAVSNYAPGLATFKDSSGAVKLYIAIWAITKYDSQLATASTTDPDKWPKLKTLPFVATASAPAFAVFNNSLYAAFSSTTPTAPRLSFTRTSDGVNWIGAPVAVLKSKSAPGLAVWSKDSKLYMEFESTNTNQYLAFTATAKGATWLSPDTRYASVQVGSAPAVAEFNGLLYSAFKTKDPYDYVAFTYSGATKAATNVPKTKSEDAPALAVFKSKLYLAYRSADKKNDVYIANFDGKAWSSPVAINAGKMFAASAPALAAFDDRLFVAFKSSKTGNKFAFSSSLDAVTWSSPSTEIDNTALSGAPALAVYNGLLFAAYQGTDAAHSLNVLNTADGVTWQPAVAYPSIPAGSAPAMAAFNGRLYLALYDPVTYLLSVTSAK